VHKWHKLAIHHQKLRNLLENAIKFTPEEGRILVSVGKDQDQVVIAVAMPGHSRVMDWGLAFVKAVADGLGVTISAQNTSPGARFGLHLPME
jgi:K+-sensing histidine kinase KdpD